MMQRSKSCRYKSPTTPTILYNDKQSMSIYGWLFFTSKASPFHVITGCTLSLFSYCCGQNCGRRESMHLFFCKSASFILHKSPESKRKPAISDWFNVFLHHRGVVGVSREIASERQRTVKTLLTHSSISCSCQFSQKRPQ